MLKESMLDKLQAEIKSGQEKLTFNNEILDYSLLDFWRWSVSDILSNATRGRFAEFIVASAINFNKNTIRDEWSAYDLETVEGIKLEIKSAAYLQSWFQTKLSKISFDIKATRLLDSITNVVATEKVRQADVYVLCLLHHKDKLTVNPLNMNQWLFYVLATKQLNEYQRSQHSTTLNSLQKLATPVSYSELHNEILKKQLLNHD